MNGIALKNPDFICDRETSSVSGCSLNKYTQCTPLNNAPTNCGEALIHNIIRREQLQEQKRKQEHLRSC